jgi:hypothetical protein
MSDPSSVYRHTQTASGGVVSVALLALLAIVVAAVASPGEPVLFALGLGLAFGMLLLHSVHVQVDDAWVTIRVGVGWIRWQIAREDIVSVRPVELLATNAWPLHRHEGAWVVGFEATTCVRIAWADAVLYVATPEPVELTLALDRPAAERS